MADNNKNIPAPPHDPSKNTYGHNPGGATADFMRRHSSFKVPLKLSGKRGRTEAGDILTSSFIFV